jgi:hypothetical protein
MEGCWEEQELALASRSPEGPCCSSPGEWEAFSSPPAPLPPATAGGLAQPAALPVHLVGLQQQPQQGAMESSQRGSGVERLAKASAAQQPLQQPWAAASLQPVAQLLCTRVLPAVRFRGLHRPATPPACAPDREGARQPAPGPQPSSPCVSGLSGSGPHVCWQLGGGRRHTWPCLGGRAAWLPQAPVAVPQSRQGASIEVAQRTARALRRMLHHAWHVSCTCWSTEQPAASRRQRLPSAQCHACLASATRCCVLCRSRTCAMRSPRRLQRPWLRKAARAAGKRRRRRRMQKSKSRLPHLRHL